jgi:membrane protease YdiL (CAAX protease family)
VTLKEMPLSQWNLNTTGEVLKTWNIDKKSILWLVPVMVIANSVVEEIYWRGYVFLKLKETVKPLTAVVLSSLFYASYHLLTTGALFSFNYALLCTAAIFTAGFFWAFIRLKTNSIWFPIITHLFADLGVMLVYIRYFA